jgi:hypothetical protein
LHIRVGSWVMPPDWPGYGMHPEYLPEVV